MSTTNTTPDEWQHKLEWLISLTVRRPRGELEYLEGLLRIWKTHTPRYFSSLSPLFCFSCGVRLEFKEICPGRKIIMKVPQHAD